MSTSSTPFTAILSHQHVCRRATMFGSEGLTQFTSPALRLPIKRFCGLPNTKKWGDCASRPAAEARRRIERILSLTTPKQMTLLLYCHHTLRSESSTKQYRHFPWPILIVRELMSFWESTQLLTLHSVPVLKSVSPRMRTATVPTWNFNAKCVDVFCHACRTCHSPPWWHTWLVASHETSQHLHPQSVSASVASIWCGNFSSKSHLHYHPAPNHL